jgi:hypothetical protein
MIGFDMIAPNLWIEQHLSETAANGFPWAALRGKRALPAKHEVQK